MTVFAPGFVKQSYWLLLHPGYVCLWTNWNLRSFHHQPQIESLWKCWPQVSALIILRFTVSSVSSVTQSYPTLCNPKDCSMPGFPVYHQLPELAQTHVHRVGDAIQPSHPLPLLLPPSIFLSISVYSNESVLCIRWPKYWSFSFSISPSSEYSGLISFKMDWLDLRAVQGTLKSLLQHHSSKTSILWLSAYFMVQLSHPYMTTGNILEKDLIIRQQAPNT